MRWPPKECSPAAPSGARSVLDDHELLRRIPTGKAQSVARGCRLTQAMSAMPPVPHRVKVLLVDDHHLFSECLRTVLASTEDISVVGEASTGREAFQMHEELQPDIVTVDVTMPDGDGILATREILRRRPNTRVLMLPMHGNHYYQNQAIAAGARGYAQKAQLPTE